MLRPISRNQFPLRSSILLALCIVSFLAPDSSFAQTVSRPINLNGDRENRAVAEHKELESRALKIESWPVAGNNGSGKQDIRERIYAKPARTQTVTPADVSEKPSSNLSGTLVTEKINDLQNNHDALLRKVGSLADFYGTTQRENEGKAAIYYAAVATINTQMQAGTTPGNPRLLKKLSEAETSLDNLGKSSATLNRIALDAATAASEAAYLLESARAAYGLSGAVEEDHVRLAQMEDEVNNTIVLIERILNNVNDDITRTSTYMSSEQANLRTLALSVSNGDLYGKSLANRPFSSMAGTFRPVADASSDAALAPVQQSSAAGAPPPPLSGPRPLVKIRFDKTSVDYEQPVYLAVNEALQRYPDARFDLVAVHPTGGNAAQVAIESTKARRNAEKVLRTLTQMGLSLDRIDLSNSESAQATSNEVHLYIR